MTLVLFAVMNLGALWRVVQALRTPHDRALRALALCLVCACAGYALAVPDGTGDLAALAGDSVPEHRWAKTAQYLLVMACCYTLMCFYLHSSNAPKAQRRARYEGAVLAAVMAALVGLAASAPHGALTRSYAEADMRLWPVLGFYGLTGLYLGYSMGAACWWTITHARISHRPHSTGLWLAGSGMGAMALACVSHIVVMTTRALGGTAPWTPVAVLVLALGVLTFVTGLAYPAVHLRMAGALLWCRRIRAYRRLEPLWCLLTHTGPASSPAASSGRSGRGVHRRLHHRIIECRDGLVRMSPQLAEPDAESPSERSPDSLAARLIQACESESLQRDDRLPAVSLALPAERDHGSELHALLRLADSVRAQSAGALARPKGWLAGRQ